MICCPLSIEQRHIKFLSRAERNDRGCLVWTGAKTPKGYGNFGGSTRDGKWTVYAHRVAWEFHNGPVPEGLCVLHRCDNPPCGEPTHLFLGTKAENNADCWLKGRYSRGEGRWKAVLREAEIPAILSLLALGFSQARIARMFGVGHYAIHAIAKGKSWKHVQASNGISQA
jgi:hypothetical protein